MSELDTARAEAFAARMTGMLNDGFLALMTSLGHETGLLDAIDGLPPSTTEEIAAAAGLNERYVREWLGAMVTGRIVEYEPADRSYRLPPEHAASITRAAGTGNLAAMLQWVGLMGTVEPGIAECFRKGGGLPYSAYGRFHEIMADSNGRVFDHTLVQATLPPVPEIAERLRSGIDVLDLGCGSGHAVNVMARAYPKSRFVGYDFSEEGVATGRAEAGALGLQNSRFEVRDAAAFGDASAFDFITTFDSIHDQGALVVRRSPSRERLRPNRPLPRGHECGALQPRATRGLSAAAQGRQAAQARHRCGGEEATGGPQRHRTGTDRMAKPERLTSITIAS